MAQETPAVRRARLALRLRERARAYGRELARARGCHVTELFDASLGGDLARRQILRRLLRESPEAGFSLADRAVEKELAP